MKFLIVFSFIIYFNSSIQASIVFREYVNHIRSLSDSKIFVEGFKNNREEYLKKLKKGFESQGFSTKGLEELQTIGFELLTNKISLSKEDIKKLSDIATDKEVFSSIRGRAFLILYGMTGIKNYIYDALDSDLSVIGTFAGVRDDDFSDIFIYFLSKYRKLVLQTKDFKIPNISPYRKEYRTYSTLKHEIINIFKSFKIQNIDSFYVKYFLVECRQFGFLSNLKENDVAEIVFILKNINKGNDELINIFLNTLSPIQKKKYEDSKK